MKTSFGKIMAASMVGFLLASIISFILFFGVIGAFVSKISKTDNKVTIQKESVLKIDLSQPIPDRTPDNPFATFNFDPYDIKKTVGLNDILRSLEVAKKDNKIKGIYLDISSANCGMATAEEIRDAIVDFRESSGKWVIAYADNFTQKAYYVASAADEIYINPQGLMDFRGLSAQIMYYKSVLDKIGVKPQVFRHGKFKSAVEPFLVDEMSEANRLQTMTYLNALWGKMLKTISEERNISIDKLNDIADNLSIREAQDAVNLGLIDGLKYTDEMIALINEKMEKEATDKINYISMAKYASYMKTSLKKDLGKDRIAVIFAEGNIVDGKGDPKKIGGNHFAEIIRKARLDDKVKAIVLRVNSPGGSGQASEIMWREIMLAKEQKPVVVSMGNLAASGGYYISCAADYIYAQPTTITGSIGVFGLMFSGEELITKKIGVNVEVVNTNSHSDMGNITRQFSDVESEYMQGMVERFYDVFITRVAEGRGMTKEQVDEIGQGRVWAGINAIEIGLVDEFGGLEEAVKKAAELANLEKYKIQEFPQTKDFFMQFFTEFNMSSRMNVLEQIPGFDKNSYSEIQDFISMDKGVYARMMMDVEIE